mgnify:CR=1 FL=1
MHREPRNPKVPKSDMDRAAKQKSVLFWDAQTAGTVPHGRLCWLGWVGYGVVFFTFRGLPGLPEILHTDEFVFAMEGAVLDGGVVVVQVLPQELREETAAAPH